MKINVEYEPGDQLLPDTEEDLFCLWVEAVYRERVKQVARWGDQRHFDDTGGETLKAQAEEAREACQAAAKHVEGGPGWRLILNEEVAEVFAEVEYRPLTGELVQVAAVTAAWWSDVKRRVE